MNESLITDYPHRCFELTVFVFPPLAFPLGISATGQSIRSWHDKEPESSLGIYFSCSGLLVLGTNDIWEMWMKPWEAIRMFRDPQRDGFVR